MKMQRSNASWWVLIWIAVLAFSTPLSGQVQACFKGDQVKGAILQKYRQLGACKGALGYPKTAEMTTPDKKGRFNHFEHGSIYWTAQTGAYSVHGHIREKWASLGWERSFLGYPITDETKTPDGKGRFNHFQGGSIYWTPETGAHEVHGHIRQKWASLGWERSHLGYPLTDEHPTPDGKGRFNHFQGGSIYWTPETGAHEVRGAIREKWASLGWERSALGYPISDETIGPDGVERFSRFQGGVIRWRPAKGAWVEGEAVEGGRSPDLQPGQSAEGEDADAATAGADLKVWYAGYTADEILYLREEGSTHMERARRKNGLTRFQIPAGGGTFDILINSCPPKADCAGPMYEVIRRVELRPGEELVVTIER